MKPPPGALYGAPRTTAEPAAGRRGLKAARRDVVVQCDRCSVNGTGRLSRGRLVSCNLAADGLRHRGCGGLLAAFDIEEAV